MLITELKNKDTILASVHGKVFILNCHGCREIHFPEHEADALQKEKITQLLDRYARNMKVQSDTESLITAKTGSDCIVVINGEAGQVIMEKNTLNDTIILQITEIIEKNTNISAKNLTIIEAK